MTSPAAFSQHDAGEGLLGFHLRGERLPRRSPEREHGTALVLGVI